MLFDAAFAMAAVAGEDELVGVTFGRECFGHVFVGDNPVMHIVAHSVWIVEIAVANMEPDAQRLFRALGDQVFVIFPRAVRGLGVVRPLLVYERPRVGKNSVVEIGISVILIDNSGIYLAIGVRLRGKNVVLFK